MVAVAGWEACRGPGGEAGGRAGPPGLTSHLPPGPWDSQGASADFSFLRMVFGLLPSWLAVFGLILSGVGRATFIRCFAGACGGLTCCAVRRLPEDISAPAASPVVQFP